MKILLDSCVWGKAAEELAGRGHDVVWAGFWPKDPGDSEILAIAYREQRVLVTLDKDFGELAVLKGQPHTGIIRLANVAAKEQANFCAYILDKHIQDLMNGAIITADSQRIRVRHSEN